ncbi:MAG TPA: TIGR01777 family oxidoreductase [Flexivirga sp.]|uniref:TIGR01777 family oxidoreductase n=1 Tax=Flexivirga sp. TaxID=1962927 RepID=UPI002C097444|nr:TIGR01777 family oxidoreductase [Flexivirga sp.]HWC23588.1 TIGR01777 family oxidoreductase [Flexivirga sp.]
MRIAITGSSGLIGTALTRALEERGDEVVKLVRRGATAADEITWHPARGELDHTALHGVSAVVNLAGAGIGDKRWTAAYKRTLVDSRVDSTSTIVDALTRLREPVRLVNGSAMGYYGDRGEETVDEESTPGSGFLVDLVTAWEAATAPAAAAGLPVAIARTGLVLSPDGGLMDRVLPLAKLGLGGPLGNGRQWWSWITLQDEVRALLHLIDHPEITGPINLAVPAESAVRQRDAMHSLGHVLHRPSFVPAPAPALRIVLGELAGDALASTRMAPTVLQHSGFEWTYTDINQAMRYVAGVS